MFLCACVCSSVPIFGVDCHSLRTADDVSGISIGELV